MTKLVAVGGLVFIAFCEHNLFVPFFPVPYEVSDVTQALFSHTTIRDKIIYDLTLVISRKHFVQILGLAYSFKYDSNIIA